MCLRDAAAMIETLVMWVEEARRKLDALLAQLREEQRLHVQTLNERDGFSKTLGEVREILCDALPNEDAPTRFMAVKLTRERDEWREKAEHRAIHLTTSQDALDTLIFAIQTLKNAKGRFHTEQAANHLFTLIP